MKKEYIVSTYGHSRRKGIGRILMRFSSGIKGSQGLR